MSFQITLVMFNSSPPEKMAAILADDNFRCIFLNESDRIPIWISLKLVPKSPIDNKLVLVQVITGWQNVPCLFFKWLTPEGQVHIALYINHKSWSQNYIYKMTIIFPWDL